MEEIDSREFSRNYAQVRHIYEPLVGGWDLYRHKTTGDKVLVKEIKFYSENDREEYLPRITECPLFQTRKDNGFLRCTGYCRKTSNLDDGHCFILYVFFEYYETTFEKVMLKKIKDSEAFTVKETLKVLNRLAASLEILERHVLVHGDVRSGNIAVMPDGKLKLIWAPFNRPTLEMMVDKPNPNLVRVMNPSPEMVEAYNESSIMGGSLSMYQDMGSGVNYAKNDVYSLGILVLKMNNLYSTDPFYIYSPNLKINTKKIEASILKLHSIHHKLGLILNNMLCYDPFERWSFGKILEVLESKADPAHIEINDTIKSISNRGHQSERHSKIPNYLINNEFTWTQQSLDDYQPQGSLDNFGGSIQLTNAQDDMMGTLRNSPPPKVAQRTLSPLRQKPSQSTLTSKSLSAVPSPNLFVQRDLLELKSEFISLIESTIFFDAHGRLRAGLKIKETPGCKYVGEVFCGKRSGIGVYYHQNGDVCVGKWVDGNMQGESIYLYADGAVYIGGVRDNRRDGFGKLLYANGDVYEGDWVRNKKNGKGIYSYYQTDNIYEGSWVLNFKEGWGTFFSRSGEWIEGEWKANRILGRGSTGIDDSFPKVKGIVDFYTNRTDWQEIIERLQSLLDRRTDDNYNYIDPKEYDHINDMIAREREELAQTVSENRDLSNKMANSQRVKPETDRLDRSTGNLARALSRKSEHGSYYSNSNRPFDSFNKRR